MTENAVVKKLTPQQQFEKDITEIYWYRYYDHFSWSSPSIYRLDITLHKFEVVKHTPKGVQLDVYGQTRFVLRGAYKRFACPTKDKAWESFEARKKRQVEILTDQKYHAEQALRAALIREEGTFEVCKLTQVMTRKDTTYA